MIKPNDLRIGNLYFRDNSIIKLTPELMSMLCDYISSSGYIPEDFKAIELTEKWLEKLGLIKESIPKRIPGTKTEPDLYEENNVWHHWVRGLFNIEIQTNGEIWFEVYSHYKHVKYVHELQNLYYALTNEELI